MKFKDLQPGAKFVWKENHFIKKVNASDWEGQALCLQHDDKYFEGDDFTIKPNEKVTEFVYTGMHAME